MQSRSFFQYLFVFFKGVAMGAADVVPGVSGGTIAFVSGIYEELIETIHQLDLGFFKVWKKQGIKQAWQQYNLGFVFTLFFGIFISILSLAKLITWLLKNHTIVVWAFFFGLILGSIVYIAKQITSWGGTTIISIVIATLLSYLITIAEPMGTPDSIWFLFVAGAIAIIAMILPGISGAFILLLLGAYKGVIDTITHFIEGIVSLNWKLFLDSFTKIAVFLCGAVIGLKSFSRILNWMFKHHKNIILSVLTGFMIGALNKIWPWKEVISTRINHSGEKVSFLEKSVLPVDYSGNPQLLSAVICVVLGFLTIFILERIALIKKKAN